MLGVDIDMYMYTYGVAHNVALSHLFSWLYLSLVRLRGSLSPSAGVGPSDNSDVWSPEAVTFFRERVHSNQFFAVVLARESSCAHVALVDTSGETDSVVGVELVQSGLAARSPRKPSVSK